MVNRVAPAFVLTASLWSLAAQSAPRVDAADMQRLAGAPWKGSLTYMDYTSKKPVTVASALVVTRGLTGGIPCPQSGLWPSKNAREADAANAS